MKQTILIATFSLFSVISFGQKKMIEKAQKAFVYYENGEKLKAAKIFEELVVEFPDLISFNPYLNEELTIKYFKETELYKKLNN